MKKIRTVLHLHPVSTVIPHADSAAHEKNPLVFRRSYDISTAVCREKTKDADAPAAMHLRGTTETPLVRCALIGAAVVGGVMLLSGIGQMCMRAKYRRMYKQRYRDRYRQKVNRVKQHNETPMPAGTPHCGGKD